ncbi:unnamed protein product [Camellia sinensis]
MSGLFFYHRCWLRNEEANSVSLVSQSSLPTVAFIKSPATIRIKRSYNGILLCKIHRVVYNCRRVGYIVCNLTTQKFTLLLEHGGNPSIAYLAFGPSQSPHYKVVLFNCSDPSYQFDICSLENKSWKHITVDVLPFNSLEVVFWNGAIH